jgi:programmed cell death 6-interacting protein
MLPVFYRATEEIPLFDAVESYVVRNFGPREFESIKPQIKALNEQRLEIARMESVDDVLLLENYERMLVSYYIGMSFIQKKFTFGTGDDCVKLTFPWKDSQTKEKKSSKNDLSLELNSVLYNLAAVMNNIGTHTPLEGDAIKTISQKFQESAWLFDHIKKTSEPLPPSCRSHDFTVENLMYLSTIQLAQSQYCFFKKAESNNMSGAILAKITWQLKSFFDEAAKYCSASKVLAKGGYLTNTYFYCAYYKAIAHYYKGLEIKDGAQEEGSGMGLAEGHLKYALSLLNGATTYDSRTKAALSERSKTIEKDYVEVQKINKNVYYEGCKSEKDLEKIDSKNFTLHRSIEVKLTEEYPGSENFEIFLPMEVRKLEGEFQQQANSIINQHFESLQK